MERRMRETHWMGLPVPGSPLVFLHPQTLRLSTRSHPHPSKKRRAGAAGIRGCPLAGEVGDRAHIPQERGGAPGWLNVCGWGRNEVVRTKVVVAG